MTLLHKSEREDFAAEITAAGFVMTEFDLIEELDPPSSPALYVATGHLVVTRSEFSRSRRYVAGHGSAWVVEFREDLLAGVFGSHR
jgi:hypothetical protein